MTLKTILTLFVIGGAGMAQAAAETEAGMDLSELSFEELLDVEVTSAGKKAQKLSAIAAAVFVISSDDISKSGATTIPEALRMVPGLSIQQIDANKWSVASRGFGGRFSNKLLVLIDGRSVYTPSFSGVYWEIHDLVMEDIDRIEVIRGPGATLWGANAVNGVINIITRSAQETEDGLMVAMAGSTEAQYLLRYGGELSSKTAFRAFGKLIDRDQFETSSGAPAGDSWRLSHIGWRLDSARPAGDQLTLQGDLVDSRINQRLGLPLVSAPYEQIIDDKVDARAWNILGRWRRPLSLSAEISAQLFVDRNRRNEAYVAQRHSTVDFELQHRFQAGRRQELVWGVGYRKISDQMGSTEQLTFIKDSVDIDLWNAFAQSDIALVRNRLGLTLGAKLEHSDYGGTEIQPNVRMVWSPTARLSLWGSVSEAVRTPSRAEVDATIVGNVTPPFQGFNASPFPLRVTISGDAIEAEELTAYELGIRLAPTAGVNIDLALFRNRYDALRTAEPAAPNLVGFSYIDLPLTFANLGYARTQGAELAAAWQPSGRWNMQLAYSFLDMEFATRQPSADLENGTVDSASPRHQLSLRASMSLSPAVSADFWTRYSSAVSPTNRATPGNSAPVAAYWDLDVAVKWQPNHHLTFRLVGQNLLDRAHAEAYTEAFSAAAVHIPRGFYASVSWAF